MNKRKVGSIYEIKALRFLESKGFLIIEKNFFGPSGEIDIICKKEDFIIFVEVKSTTEYSQRDIYSLITKNKKFHLKKTINYWLNKNNLNDAIWRFDYISFVKSESGYSLDHFEFVSLD